MSRFNNRAINFIVTCALAVLVLVTFAASVSCSPLPQVSAQVIQNNADATIRLASNDSALFGLLKKQTEAIAGAKRELMLGHIEADIILSRYVEDGVVDIAKIQGHLENAGIVRPYRNEIIAQIRNGYWTIAESADWLVLHSSVRALPTGSTRTQALDSTLARLQVVSEHDVNMSLILTGIDTWAMDTFALWQSVDANNKSLVEFATTTYESNEWLTDQAESYWSELVLGSIDNPEVKSDLVRFFGALIRNQ